MLKQISFAIAIALVPLLSWAEPRDPTMPGNLPLLGGTDSELQSPLQLSVTAIRIADDSRIAIINGQTVKPGERINDDIRILKIMPHYVLVNDHGDRKKFYLVPPIKK